MPFWQHDEISHLPVLFLCSSGCELSLCPECPPCVHYLFSVTQQPSCYQISCCGVAGLCSGDAVYLIVAPKHKSSDADSLNILLICLVCKLTCTKGMYVQEKIQFFLQTKARQLNFVGFSFPSYKRRFCSRRVLRILKGLNSYGYIRYQKIGSRLLYLKMNLSNQESNQIL